MRRILMWSTVLALSLALASPAFAEGPIVHVVQPGENLFRIALRYGVTVDALVAANGLSSASRIISGQRLAIPAKGSSASPATATSGTHIVERGENLFRIALRYGMTHQALAAANGIANSDNVYAGQRLVIPGHGAARPASSQPAASGRSYTVRRGDILSAIARRYGLSAQALAQANDIRNPSAIYAGQVLRIPGGASTAPPAPAPAATSGHGGRWIDIDLGAQRLTAYEGNTPARSTLVSTGLSRTPTPTGQYRVYVKYASKTMSGPGYRFPNVPYTMFFYRGYSIHGTYWHSNFGQPMSHGCVNLPKSEAQWLYNWASVGTRVNVHY